jgi:hypothetical protein
MSRKRVNHQTCFVVMSFDKTYDRVYESIVAAVTGPELHFPTCTRADEILGGGHIMEDVLRGIEQSEVIVADVTGRNPNVFYELGYAHKARPVQNVIIITQTMKDMPFDVSSHRCIVYEPTEPGLEKLKRDLVDFIRKVTPAHLRFAVADGDTFEFHNPLRGQDGRRYDFELGPVGTARKFAEFRLGVRRYADGRPDEHLPAESHSLDEGEGLIVPYLNWELILDAVSEGKAYFCLCEPAMDGSRRKRPARD